VSVTRRTFLEQLGIFTAAAFMPQTHHHESHPSPRQINASSVTPFVDPLPRLQVAQPTGTRPSPENSAVKLPYYRMVMHEFESKVHRDLKPTRMWGFGNSSPGPTFETRSGQGFLVEWVNQLPTKHFLPIDHNIHGAEADKPDVRTVVHLHGAKVPPKSDGYPEDWFVPGKSALCHYPNNQEAAMLWYHDHTLGINRLNVYAGLMGACIVRDDFEEMLNLPKGKHEIPLIIYDRSFDSDGQFTYEVSPDPKAPWVPEMFADGFMVNGKLFPYLDVEACKYRFRLLNAANGRFFNLSLSNGQTFQQIGSDQGLLSAPIQLKKIVVAPGERVDLIIDFSESRGQKIVLQTDTFNVMQFRVASMATHDTSSLPAILRPVARLEESSAVQNRTLSLIEWDEPHGNPMIILLNGAHWNMPVTESPVLNTVEIWNLFNTTDDPHPIHLHLVRFQVLERRSFDIDIFQHTNKVVYTAPPVPPEPGETGWKDTVPAHPGMVTRIIAKFEGYPGRYVWHCHILEHEDNEMMRPFDVVAAR
jgi:spore coat protein A